MLNRRNFKNFIDSVKGNTSLPHNKCIYKYIIVYKNISFVYNNKTM